MVKNREELIQVASSNANQLKTHLRRAVESFLKAQRVKPEDLAYVLGITNNEMAQILEGDVNVSIDTLSKLLVATDLVVEIKPIRNTPLGGYGPHMPRSGGFPGYGGIPVDENGNPLPPPPGFLRPDFMRGPGAHENPRQNRESEREEVPMETTQRGPARDEHGRFVRKGTAGAPHRRQPEAQPQRHDDNPYFKMSRMQLCDIIRANIWDGEIDTDRATFEQLAGFVTEKENIMRQRQGERTHGPAEQPERQPQHEAPAIGGGSDTLNKFLGMLGNIAKEAESNPQLMETINRFMPK